MRHLRERLSRFLSCLISAALVATSSHVVEASPKATPDALERFAPARGDGYMTDAWLAPASAEARGPRAEVSGNARASELGTRPIVVLIQDLHLHYPTQKRIVRILDHLYSKGLVSGALAMEGVEGSYDTSKIASYPEGKIKSELVDYFMKKGELSAPEAFSVLRGDGHLLYGVDKAQYYDLNRNLFKASREDRNSLRAQLTRIQSGLDLLKRKHYPYALRHLDKEEAYSMASAEKLLNQKLALCPDDMTRNLVTADHMLRLTQRLVRQEVTLEEARYIAQRLPAFVSLTDQLLKADNKAVIARRSVQPKQSVMSSENGQIATLPSVARDDSSSLNVASIQETLKSAIDFYLVALMRNEPMAENTLALMGNVGAGLVPARNTNPSNFIQSRPDISLRAGTRPAPTDSVPALALVAGGFHTAGLTKAFKKAGVSYVVITPAVPEAPDAAYRELYENRLAGVHISEAEVAKDLHLKTSDSALGASYSSEEEMVAVTMDISWLSRYFGWAFRLPRPSFGRAISRLGQLLTQMERKISWAAGLERGSISDKPAGASPAAPDLEQLKSELWTAVAGQGNKVEGDRIATALVRTFPPSRIGQPLVGIGDAKEGDLIVVNWGKRATAGIYHRGEDVLEATYDSITVGGETFQLYEPNQAAAIIRLSPGESAAPAALRPVDIKAIASGWRNPMQLPLDKTFVEILFAQALAANGINPPVLVQIGRATYDIGTSTSRHEGAIEDLLAAARKNFGGHVTVECTLAGSQSRFSLSPAELGGHRSRAGFFSSMLAIPGFLIMASGAILLGIHALPALGLGLPPALAAALAAPLYFWAGWFAAIAGAIMLATAWFEAKPVSQTASVRAEGPRRRWNAGVLGDNQPAPAASLPIASRGDTGPTGTQVVPAPGIRVAIVDWRASGDPNFLETVRQLNAAGIEVQIAGAESDSEAITSWRVGKVNAGFRLAGDYAAAANELLAQYVDDFQRDSQTVLVVTIPSETERLGNALDEKKKKTRVVTLDEAQAIAGAVAAPAADLAREKVEGAMVAEKLRAPLHTEDAAMAERFAKGGYKDDGYGVPNGAAIDGSHTENGIQGYYSRDINKNGRTGKEEYLFAYNIYRKFFKKHADRGRPIRYIIKIGIGGQHTPMQAIADGFMTIIDAETGKIVGEYELGKNYEAAIDEALAALGVGWDQIAVIPSSKSGSTDESMLIFQQILYAMMKHAALDMKFSAGQAKSIADTLFRMLHETSVDAEGNDRPGRELFKGFTVEKFVEELARENVPGLSRDQAVAMFRRVLGNMVFETTPNVGKSRLAAFIMNSGLDAVLGEDAPPMIDMFDNVGGRWTADVHMLVVLAYYGLDVGAYYDAREKGIRAAREGNHPGNLLAHETLDTAVRQIAFLLPDRLFWFGKAIEQNLNESIWQNGFVNLVAIRESDWADQQQHYAGRSDRMVIDMTESQQVSRDRFNVKPMPVQVPSDRQKMAQFYAGLYTTFYAMTNTIGTRLIARAVRAGGHSVSEVDLNNLDNAATKIVRSNLFLLQPFVELGKGFLEADFKKLQNEERKKPGAIRAAMKRVQDAASRKELKTNVKLPGVRWPERIEFSKQFHDVVNAAFEFAQSQGRKFVPIVYLEGKGFVILKAVMTATGVEWVMQGTADQHISVQQLLAQPQHYLPFIVSVVPSEGQDQPGLPSVFAKAYLNEISPDLARDFFAANTYRAFTDEKEGRGAVGGRAFFLRLKAEDLPLLGDVVQTALLPKGSSLMEDQAKARPAWVSTAFKIAASVLVAVGIAVVQVGQTVRASELGNALTNAAGQAADGANIGKYVSLALFMGVLALMTWYMTNYRDPLLARERTAAGIEKELRSGEVKPSVREKLQNASELIGERLRSLISPLKFSKGNSDADDPVKRAADQLMQEGA